MSATPVSNRVPQPLSTAALLALLAASVFTFLLYLALPARALATTVVPPPDKRPPSEDRMQTWQPRPVPPRPVPPRPIPPPPPPRLVPPRAEVVIDALDLDVDMRDAVATTHLHEKIRNPYGQMIEAQFVLPIPRGATVHDASLRVDGQLVEAEIMEAGDARSAYEDIVRRRIDPALVEYMEDGLLRTRVFPVPPHGSREIELTLTLALVEDFGVWQYRFPLRAFASGQAMPREFSLRGTIESSIALSEPYSPTHDLDVDVQRDGHHARFELRAGGPELSGSDLQLFVPTRARSLTFTVASTRPAGEDGFVLVRITPGTELERREPTARQIVFVLDQSGSMQGEKLQQACDALRAALRTLRPEDRFAVVTYASSVTPWSDKLVPGTPEAVREALNEVNAMRASGGTNIGDALSTALDMLEPHSRRPAYVLFLTDGLPTVGTRSIDALIDAARRENRVRARLFAFGVGNDVNTRLLDTLAGDSGALARYVLPGEDLEVAVSNLAAQIADPLWTDVRLELAGAGLYDMVPVSLGDLFAGQSLTVLARYRNPGRTTLQFSGEQDGHRERVTQKVELARRATSHSYLPQLWAGRRIAVLQSALRDGGDRREIIQEIVELATRYGIVTEYTSMLMREPNEEIARAVRSGAPVPESAPLSFERLSKAETGKDAVRSAARASRLMDSQSLAGQAQAMDDLRAQPYQATPASGAENAPASVNAPPRQARSAAGRTFELDEQGRWVDRLAVGATPRLKIRAFSTAYFEALRLRPELGDLLSVGENVLVAVGSDVLEVGSDGVETLDAAARAWLSSGLAN